ncbi:branched chain amino acid ABC transporter substrate-binding protein [Anopheles sinensis]|uniref:Branched chain amino acid ABC transporter substrate-binding protein n=1 Tax=Anopheles sinensis TaxID=74873 RepID=A0A084WCH5_ANOSI|nr:branched chain amino acid ABC transporter substrate-binding protein [Anopheles sinensis]
MTPRCTLLIGGAVGTGLFGTTFGGPRVRGTFVPSSFPNGFPSVAEMKQTESRRSKRKAENVQRSWSICCCCFFGWVRRRRRENIMRDVIGIGRYMILKLRKAKLDDHGFSAMGNFSRTGLTSVFFTFYQLFFITSLRSAFGRVQSLVGDLLNFRPRNDMLPLPLRGCVDFDVIYPTPLLLHLVRNANTSFGTAHPRIRAELKVENINFTTQNVTVFECQTNLEVAATTCSVCPVGDRARFSRPMQARGGGVVGGAGNGQRIQISLTRGGLPLARKSGPRRELEFKRGERGYTFKWTEKERDSVIHALRWKFGNV